MPVGTPALLLWLTFVPSLCMHVQEAIILYFVKLFSLNALEQASPVPLPLLQAACNAGFDKLVRLLIEEQADLNVQV